MPATIKLVIFDLDGTLVDAYKAVADSVNNALTTCGFAPVDDEKVKRSVGWGEKVLIEKLTGGRDVERVLAAYRVHHKKALKTGTAFLPGAQELLEDLRKKRYQLAIASNRPSYFTLIILKHLKIYSHFKCVVCADQVGRPKPAGDMLDTILRRLSLAPAQALYIGDMALDVQTGRHAGIRTVAVLTGSCTRQELEDEKPLAVLDRISRLRDILEGLEKG